MQPYSRKDRYSHRQTIVAMVAAGVIGLGGAAVMPTGQGAAKDTLRGQSSANTTSQPITARQDDEWERDDLA